MDFNSPLLENLKQSFIQSLPKALGILLFIIVAWIVFKILVLVIKRLLRFSKIDALNEKINDNPMVARSNIEVDLKKIILVAAKWIIVLLLVVVGTAIFELERIAEGLGEVIAFLPTLFTALLILCLGIWLATYLKKFTYDLLKSFGINGAKAISSVICFAILLIALIIALEELGINTEIITDNLSIILGAFLIAIAIAVGLGSKEVVQRLLFGFYLRKNLKRGQAIRIDGTEGTIVSIDNISLILESGNQKIVYPIKTVADKKIEILA